MPDAIVVESAEHAFPLYSSLAVEMERASKVSRDDIYEEFKTMQDESNSEVLKSLKKNFQER